MNQRDVGVAKTTEMLKYDAQVLTVALTCVHIVVPIQRSELLAIVPSEGVSSVTMVAAHPQLVEFGLRLDAEACVLCKGLAT